MANETMGNAKKKKADEFYTQLSDIEQELKHYKQHFKGKTVFCNCDDPYESNFFKYFALNFNYLGLKKLVTTSFGGSPIAFQQLSLFDVENLDEKERKSRTPYKLVITEVSDHNEDGAYDLTDVEFLIKNSKNVLTVLKGDGDFRSKECVELIKDADIVVTNPPFSLFREYVAQLFEYGKKFVIIGNKNALTYKEIFPLIQNNQMWTGYRGFSGGMWFFTDEIVETTKVVDGKRLANVPSIWFTNLEIPKRHEEITLYKRFNPKEYLKYDNYEAINVDSTSDIPCDYDGTIGVPITFLDKYNPDQFEIIKFRKGNDEKDLAVNGKCPYFRVLIKNRKVQK